MTNMTATLIIPLEGVLTQKGNYDYRERTTKGSILPDHQRLFIKKHPEFSDCKKVINLTEHFVNHAISMKARPDKEDNFRMYKMWPKLSLRERLAYHIQLFAYDLRAFNYSFEIHE